MSCTIAIYQPLTSYEDASMNSRHTRNRE